MSTLLTTADRALYAERCRVVDLEKKLAIAEAASRPVFSRRMLEEKLAASEERARRLEGALREIDAKIGHFRSLESEVTFPLALIPVCAGIARAALAPPPETAKKGGEKP